LYLLYEKTNLEKCVIMMALVFVSILFFFWTKNGFGGEFDEETKPPFIGSREPGHQKESRSGQVPFQGLHSLFFLSLPVDDDDVIVDDGLCKRML
jgi:hypothetical protein